MSDGSSSSQQLKHTDSDINDKSSAENKSPTDMKNILAHIKSLETNNNDLQAKLEDAMKRNGKLSQKTREGMQSALDTLMKKWMDAVETKDDTVKNEFRTGLEKLVKNSAEDNGVWQMMVSASALHQRQEHNLEKLKLENDDLRQKVDGMYGTSESRVVGGKGKAEKELSREDVERNTGIDIWAEFGSNIGSSF